MVLDWSGHPELDLRHGLVQSRVSFAAQDPAFWVFSATGEVWDRGELWLGLSCGDWY